MSSFTHLTLEASWKEALLTTENFFSNTHNLSQLAIAIEKFAHIFAHGGRVFSMGNGGSMCDAMHFAEELTGRYRKDRKSLPAVAISEPGYLTCVANDYGYDFVFSRYLEGWAQKGDGALLISTSGNSANVVKAAEVAKKQQLFTVGLLGKEGGALKNLVDIPLIVPSQITDRIQEVHIKIIHMMIEGIERQLFPENYR
jgi:D-sedoheptulose 7-phosphate isomerase